MVRESVDIQHIRLVAVIVPLALVLATGVHAQASDQPALTLGDAGYYEAPAVNWLVFSNWYDGLFADAKISGVELIQQGERIATNGDVRLSETPGPWGAIGGPVDRTTNAAAGPGPPTA